MKPTAGATLCAGMALVAATVACRPAPSVLAPTADATIKDIMVSIVDPAADALWGSVGTTFSEHGVEERAPRTEEEWAALRRSAIQLLEAPNLLIVEGRLVARPHEKSANPEVERSPEQMQAAISDDRKAWNELASGLREAAQPILKAIEARDVQQLAAANGNLDPACERCHLKYWYPDDGLARELLELNTRK